MINDYSTYRYNMVQFIKTWDVNDNNILELMENISREMFFPEETSKLSYVDAMVPIGFGQVSLEPKMIARILQSLNLKKNHKVLEIGTGTGYTTTLLSHLVKEVYTIEIIPEISEKAKKLFKNLNLKNIDIKTGNGMFGWDDKMLFDKIIVTGSLFETPVQLISKLKDNGQLFATIGNAPVMRAVTFTKNKGNIDKSYLFDTNIPKMQEISESEKFDL